MRRALLVLPVVLAVAACATPRESGPSRTGTCPSTVTRDATGAIVSKGAIGLFEIKPASFPGEKTMVFVRRGAALGDVLELRAVAEGSGARGQVMWSTAAKNESNPWGSVVFEVNTKPIGNGGCWRLALNDGPQDDAIVVDLGG